MYPQSMFSAKIKKNITFFHLNIIFFTTKKNCSILHGCVFVMHVSFVAMGLWLIIYVINAADLFSCDDCKIII